VVSFATLTVLVVLPLLALPNFRVANLAYVNLPFLNGQPFDPGVLRLIFGVMLTNFFSHLLVANYGRVVLQRDPTARAWIWGCVAAIGATTLISCLWVLLINGAIAPGVLAAEAGTVLPPPAALAGPIVNLMGSVVVVLGLGIGSIHVSLGTFYLSQERLPENLSARSFCRGGGADRCGVPPGGVAGDEWLGVVRWAAGLHWRDCAIAIGGHLSGTALGGKPAQGGLCARGRL
jgi:hypothetical protein